MTRENMHDRHPREDWITQEIEDKIRGIAQNGFITCAQAQAFAEKEAIPMKNMKPLLDVLKIKVIQCQLGCF